MSLLQQLPNQLLNFLLPKFCVHCGKFGYYLCQNCYEQIKFLSKHYCPVCRRPAVDGITHTSCLTHRQIDGIISAVVYQGPVRSLVKRLKYKPYAAKIYEEIDLLLRRYFTEPERIYPPEAVLLPVPLHAGKLKERGFNQAELIAQTMGDIWGLPVQKGLLRRVKRGKDQTSLSRKKRIKNVHGLYGVNLEQKEFIKKRQFILVDDVTTTGATLRKCACLLKQNGAEKVWGATFAKD